MITANITNIKLFFATSVSKYEDRLSYLLYPYGDDGYDG